MRAHYHEQNYALPDAEKSAKRAERLGFDAYAAPEFRSDPMMHLVLASRATERLQLETRILLAYARSPMVVAYQAWSLQQYCGGRFRLGLGTSARPVIEGRYAATWNPPGRGLRDYVQALRHIWTAWAEGQHPDHAGEFYRLATRDDEFRPAPIGVPMPRIGIAGTGPIMCRLAGEISDGLMLPILNSPRFFRERSIPAMREGARAAGRDPRAIPVAATTMVWGAKNARSLREARDRARRTIAFFLSYSDIYANVLELHGWQEWHGALRSKAKAGTPIDRLTREVSDEMVDTFAVVALADEIGPRLKARYDGLLDEVVFALRPVGLGQRDQDRAVAAAIDALHAT